MTFPVCPLHVTAPEVLFAPVGLLDMFNVGAVVKKCVVTSGRTMVLRVRGSWVRPVQCLLFAGAGEVSAGLGGSGV
jgi:hypothetical protein